MNSFSDNLQEIFTAIPIAVGLWAASFALGAIIAIPVAWLRLNRIWVLRLIATVYIEVFRGIPTLVWLFLVFFGLKNVVASPTAVSSAILTLAMASSAYLAETYRSGIAAVPVQQHEATTVLGLHPWIAFTRVVWPQARPIIAAGMGSFGVHMFKETALTSLIGVVEIMTVANYLVERGANGLTVFAACGVIYMIICLPISWGARLLGTVGARRPAKPSKTGASQAPTLPTAKAVA